MSDSSTKFLSQDNKQAFRNPWVISMIAAIVLVVCVNVVFITTAFMTTPGLVEEDYYEKGRDREANIRKQLAARTKLGWNLDLNLPEKVKATVPTMFNLNAVNKQGLPIENANVTLDFYRPSDAKADFSVAMEAFAPGIYQAKAVLPLKGIWELIVTVKSGEDSYDIRQRIRADAS